MRIIFIILTFFLPFSLFGQVEYQEEKDMINKIKKNTNYLYGEGIAETEKEAIDMAEKSLNSEINRLISENKSLQERKSVIVTNIERKYLQIKLKRGTMDRVFLYVDKRNITAADNVMEIALTGNEIDKTVTDKNDVLPEKETVIEEEFVDEDNEIPEVKKDPVTEAVPETVPETEKAPTIISDIMTLNSLTNLQNYLKAQKDAHKIMYGKVGSEINPAWYLIVVSENDIKAVFDKGLNMRKNFMTGMDESLMDYSKYSKIWLTVYE